MPQQSSYLITVPTAICSYAFQDGDRVLTETNKLSKNRLLARKYCLSPKGQILLVHTMKTNGAWNIQH